MTALLLSVAVSLQPLVSEDVLEPSVQNEVDHAISKAPAEAWTAATNVVSAVAVEPVPPAPCPVCGSRPSPVAAKSDRPVPLLPDPDWFGTNGLSATAIALRLVTSQQPDGRWLVGTNDVTVTALRILNTL